MPNNLVRDIDHLARRDDGVRKAMFGASTRTILDMRAIGIVVLLQDPITGDRAMMVTQDIKRATISKEWDEITIGSYAMRYRVPTKAEYTLEAEFDSGVLYTTEGAAYKQDGPTGLFLPTANYVVPKELSDGSAI